MSLRTSVRASIVVLAAALAGAGHGLADEPTRVRVIATGGTIARAPDGWLSAEQLVASLPGRRRPGGIQAETFAQGPSTGLPLERWVALSRRIRTLFETDSTLSGVVVTAGTDTLEELAWFLYLTIPDERPVVVVGAMRPPGSPDSDGPGNLADGIRVAATPDARGLGTVAVMHGEVMSARYVRKRHTAHVSAFDAPGRERTGDVRRGRVRLTRHAAGGLVPGALAFPEEAVLPRVDILLTYQGAGGDLIDAAIAAGARGLVLASAGAGSLTPAQQGAARRAAAAGVPVVVSSRVGAGPVRAQRYSAAGTPVLAAGDLQPLKARLLLMLALARGMTAADIERLFR
jgi:L-asparaginase